MKNRILMTALVSFLAFGCGEDDEPANNPTNNGTNNSTTPTNNSTTPTNNPTNNNTTPQNNPTNNATNNPTNNATNNPTNNATNNPTNNATNNPTNNQTVVESCAAIAADECLYTFDCEAATDVCETQNNSNAEVRCCVPGTRGTKALGEACNAENDCTSGACLNDVCADPCDAQNMCPTNYTCQPALGLCVPE